MKTKLTIPEVRNPYNYDADALSDATGLRCPEPSKTQQEFAEEADINYIAERFMRTGQMPQVVHMPTQGDFEGIFDFQSAMNTIVTAKNEFMALPAKIRSRFQNDPAQLIAFLEDGDNYDEAVKLGLVEKRPAGPTQAEATIPPATNRPGQEPPAATGPGDKTPRGTGAKSDK